MVFPVVIYGCESWIIKKAECLRIDVFELWCWRRLLRVPWTARRSNQSILKEISPDWFWSWNFNILATWCKELTHLKRPWFWERLRAGGGGDNRGWNGWMASLTQRTWVWVNSGSWCRQGGLACCSSWGRKESDMTEWLNWTETASLYSFIPTLQLRNVFLFIFNDVCRWVWLAEYCLPLQRCPLPSGYVILHDKKDFVFIIEIMDWLNGEIIPNYLGRPNIMHS